MASQNTALKENKQTIVNFASFIIDNAVPAIAALGSAICNNESWSVATTICEKVSSCVQNDQFDNDA